MTLDIADYKTESWTVSKGIQDALWVLQTQIDKQVVPAFFEMIQATAQDHIDITRTPFVGIIPTVDLTLAGAVDKSLLIGYDYAWYLTVQYVPSDDRTTLEGTNPSETITSLLGGTPWVTVTGIEPYRINNVVDWTNIKKVFEFGDRCTRWNAIKEIALSGRLNKYDIELDDLLMELRAIKGGRHLGIDAAIKKYEKRIWGRPGEELYIVDKNGQRIFYNSSTEAGLSGFADIRGAASNGIMLMNQADGKVVMIEDYLRYAASSNLAEVRMVAGDKVYIIRRTGKWDRAYYEDVVSPTMHKVKRDLNAALIAADKESRIGTGWYDRQVWKRTAAQCDEIEYDEAIPSSLIKPKPKTVHEIAEERSIRQRREEERLKDILRKIAGG